VALAASAALALPAVSSAAINPGFTQFTGCPQRDDVGACQTATITGGSFKLGNKVVPITSPITLTGGVTNAEVARLVYGPGGGLKSAPIKVPGGLSGMTGLGEAFLNLITFGSNDVYATPELVADPTITPEGINLPLRIKLKNNFLASSCAIGSASAPVLIKLITGTTTPPAGYTPLTGAQGESTFDDQKFIITTTGVKYVDNTFSVPGASGCGSYLGPINVGLINNLVNSTIGIPATPGKSQAIQSGVTIQVAVDTSKVFS
jgi:hypothetical protein